MDLVCIRDDFSRYLYLIQKINKKKIGYLKSLVIFAKCLNGSA